MSDERFQLTLNVHDGTLSIEDSSGLIDIKIIDYDWEDGPVESHLDNENPQ